jgi:hypothetical protein
MKKIIWESLLDAEMNVRYWKRLTQRYLRRDKAMKIFIAISSSGTVAAWSIWSEHPAVWKVLSAIAAIVGISMPIFNYQKTIEIASELSGKWWEIRNEYEQQWNDLKNNEDISELRKRHSITKQKEVPLVEREAKISEDNKLLRKCFDDVKRQYGI